MAGSAYSCAPRQNEDARAVCIIPEFRLDLHGRIAPCNGGPEPGDGGGSSSLSFEVRVPHRFDVEFESMGGGLELIDLEGEFGGSTMGGGITLKNLKGKARLSTMGGERGHRL